MKLETAESLGFDHVTEQQLREVFANDEGRGELVILSQKPEVYIQTSGEVDGPYALEYRDGNADRHFSAGKSFRKADVEQALKGALIHGLPQSSHSVCSENLDRNSDLCFNTLHGNRRG